MCLAPLLLLESYGFALLGQFILPLVRSTGIMKLEFSLKW